MVKIRLMRVGKKKQPSFRVVVADSRSPRDGRIIETIGNYQPRQDPSEISIDNDRAVHWLNNGAQPSGQVRHLLEISGAWASFTGEEVVRAPITPAEGKKKATPAASVTVAEETATPEEPAAEDAPSSEEPEPAEEPVAAAEAEPDGSPSAEPAAEEPAEPKDPEA